MSNPATSWCSRTRQIALDYTLREGVAAFGACRGTALWVKGETSGNLLDVVEVRVNCEQNSLLYLVRLPQGGVCHTLEAGAARHSCYYRRLNGDRLETVARGDEANQRI